MHGRSWHAVGNGAVVLGLAWGRALDAPAKGCVVVMWRPSAEQLAALNAGALVQLHVWGRAHPPVSLDVEEIGGSKIIQAETEQ